MRLTILAFIAISVLPLSSSAQLTTSVTYQDESCYGAADGAFTVEAILGCFPPIIMVLDSDTSVFGSLISNGYDFIHQGESQDPTEANAIWGGNSSIGEVYVTGGYYRDSISFGSTTLTSAGGRDGFLVCHNALTNDPLWAVSIGGVGFDGLLDVTVSNNTVYAVGFFSDSMAVQSSSISSNGSLDSYIAKLDLATGLVDTLVTIGSASPDFANSIKIEGNEVYVGGGYLSSITLASTTLPSSGLSDLYVVNMDTNFSQDWAESAGGVGNDVLSDLTISDGKTYLTGAFRNTASFGSTSLASTGQSDVFVASLSSTGNWLWAIDGGGGGASAYDQGFGIDATPTGDTLYVGGYYLNSLDFGNASVSSNGGYDGFILKVDTSGTDHGIMTIGGLATDAVYDLDVISDELISFAGQMEGNVIYGDSTYASNGGLDAFMGKLTSSFDEVWAKNLGGSNQDSYNTIDRGSSDRLYSAGFFMADASAYQSGLISAGARDVMITNGSFFGMADTSITMTGLSAGEYYIYLADGAGNTEIDTITISSPDSLSLSGVVTNASSGAANDGSIDLTVTGGTPGYSYIWSIGAITQDIMNLTSGAYCVTVTDSNGCMDSTCFFVDTTGGSNPFMVTSMFMNISCFGDSNGSINLTVSGGIMPYSFSWSNGAGTEDLTGLGAGTYTVTVTDSDTSQFIDSFNITEPAEIVLSSNITSPSSGTATDGAIDLTVSGGVMPYSFNWSNGPTSEDLTGIGIGNYSVTVTDSSGCVVTATFAVDTLAALSLVLAASDVTCINTINGAIDLTVIGGAAPFTFAWSNGATTEDISGLTPGAYSVTVTDSTGQIATGTDSVGSNPIHPDPTVGPITGPGSVQAWTNYNYSVPSTNGSAFTWTATGGSVISTASNAAVIQWNAGPSGLITVGETDANGCAAVDTLGVIILFVGTENVSENAVVIFPIPVVDVLNIQVPQIVQGASLEISNMIGQSVHTSVLNNASNQVQLGGLQTGTYLILMTKEDIQLSTKIVVK